MRYLRWALLAALCAGCDDGGGSATVDAAMDGTTGDIDALPGDMNRPDMPVVDMAVEDDMAVGDDMTVIDMAPDAAPMCQGAEGCDDENRCTADDCVDGTCVNTPLDGCCNADGDCPDGVCLDDLGQCADRAAVGSVVITELLVDPDGVSDTFGEWIEIHNPTAAPITLNGWTLAVGDDSTHEIDGDAPIVIAPGAWFVLAANADAGVNGGVAVDYEYSGIRLTNQASSVALRDAFGEVIDTLEYGADWPLGAGATLALDPGSLDAAANDDAANWCPGQMPWAGGDRGTPGAANPPCTPPVELADWCRLQFPLDVEAAPGEELTVYIRAFEAGVTDRTDATDPDPAFLVQVGYGADGSDPAADPWSWVDAGPNMGWNAADAGEPGNDEYQATFGAPDPGTYDHAGRVSADGGDNWIYCDRAAGEGSDGAEDGYQIANAGSLTVIDAACVDVNCDRAPASGCDGNERVIHAIAGECRSVDGAPECVYPEAERVDCGDQVCVAGECVDPAPLPGIGELVITEILYDPHGPLAEETAEWFEVYNDSGADRSLNGCRLSDSANTEIIEGLQVPAGGHLVFGRSADPAVNGGIAVDYVFGFGLNNGGDTLTITCGPADAEVVVDTVAYDSGEAFPDARRASIALDPATRSEDENDVGANWCLAEDVYYMPADQPEEEWHRGTPGAANPPCPEPDVTVDWCRLQFPLDPVAGAGTVLTVYGRVFEAGITDRTPMVDPAEGFMAQLGYGAVGSQPGAEWTWLDAAPNPGWMDAEEPNNDEYQADLLVPEAGQYAFAYRFSRDAGESWLYCDRNAGPGSDGAEDGYQPENAGLLTSVVGPCDGVICAEPPLPVCDRDVLVTFDAVGQCEEIEGEAVCAYIDRREDCAANGGRCQDGECVGGARAPNEGDLVITEIMYDPHHALSDGDAEWFEVYNRSGDPLDLNGCVFYDSANEQLIEAPVLIAPDSYTIFGQNPDPAVNGGLEFAAIFGFGLNNTGDTIGIRCGEVVIDVVAYDDGPEFPDALARSIILIDREADNAFGPNWCLSTSVYFEDADPALSNLGTPGAPNDQCNPCDPNPCLEPPANGCKDPNTRIVYPPVGACQPDEGPAPFCSYDPVLEPCDEGEVCEDGACLPVGARGPEAGEVVVNEIMYDPHHALADGDAEWFELHNTTDEPLTLAGCTVTDTSPAVQALDGLVIGPRGFLLFAASDNPEINGGLAPDAVLEFSLGNGGDSLTLTCPAGEIDTVAYDDGDAFPDARAHSLTLADPAADNADGANWCLGRSPYFVDPDPLLNNHGTPGAPNDPCDVIAEFGVLQFPLAIDEEAGAEVIVYGRVYHPGITDRSGATDPSPLLRAQLGFGPDGSDPQVAEWTWIRGAPNFEWDGPAAGQADNDEYQVTLRVPPPGEYDYAWRFSADGGRTWIYADGSEAGSSDGYQIANAGQLTSRVPANVCDPNPCVEPPADTCADAQTRLVYPNPGACLDLGEGAFDCSYVAEQIACPDDLVCVEGACVAPGGRAPAAGELVINEIMYDPHFALPDNNAEWFELHNATDDLLELAGCTVTDGGGGEVDLGALQVQPRGYLLFAVNGDPALNGGLEVDGTFGFSLANGGDSLTVDCPAGEIHTVAYDDGPNYPDARAHSITLADPALDATDGANWCLGRSVYFVDGEDPQGNNHGTPGAPNDPCDVAAEFGVLQFPLSIDEEVGTEVVVFGRVYHPGITDRTGATDPSPLLRAQLGFGPDGSDPQVADWIWINAAPNVEWDGPASGQPDNDEYQVTLRVPAPGEYDYAWRFSADGGRTWIYADGPDAGSSDGYQIENAGQLTSRAPVDVCDPNPCVEPPADTCADAQTRLVYPNPGECLDLGEGAFDCSYVPEQVPCAPDLACVDGACVAVGGRAPAAGELVVNEIMYDPHFALPDNNAEWFELHNATDDLLELAGCTVTDGGGGEVDLGALEVEPRGYLLFAVNGDPALNGGLDVDGTFDFSLANGGDSLTVDCPAGEIHTIAYDDGPAYPDARAHSITLADPALDATDGANWCLGRSVYFVDGEDPQGNNHGTPGAPNDPCDVAVDFGVLQFPLIIDAPQGTEAVVYGRVYQQGITDRSGGTDPSPLLRAQLGFGPDGSDPQVADWTWINGAPNVEWDGPAAGQADNDEYQVLLRVPAPGEYDYAWRFSADGGRTWTYADGPEGGSSDGYQIESAGQLIAGEPVGDVCDPNPCNDPPPPVCQDENTVLEASPEGICEAVDGQPVCDYQPQPIPCADGDVCVAGACVPDDGLRGPAAGEVIVNEIMYDPHFELADGSAEWFELYNTSADLLSLDGCVVAENNGQSVDLAGLQIEPGGYLLFVQSDDPAVNGGLAPDRTFGFALGNSGDTLTVTCGGEEIDAVTYDDGPNFPDARARSISLDPGQIADNANGAHWCLGRDVYYQAADPAQDHYATPGQPNPPCDEAVNFGRLQFPLVIGVAGPTTVYGRVYHEGITDRTGGTDPSPRLIAQLGFGTDGSDPAAGDWIWIDGVPNVGFDGPAVGEANNDEYQADLLLEPGIYDFAWRFSVDDGRTWLYADGQPAGSSDGYQPENAGQADVPGAPE